MNKIVKLVETSNSAREQIALSEPYTVAIELTGTADMLFHRWDNEAVAEKAAARKGSVSKKTDNLESYVYRDDKDYICLPGEYVRGAVVNAAKFRQDPRSPRKSAQDLFKAGVVSLTRLASMGSKQWDYEDRRRVTIQRNAITRVRPAFKAGWSAEFEFLINLPEYIDTALFREVLGMAGRLVGVGDFRPTYGRFDLTKFKVL